MTTFIIVQSPVTSDVNKLTIDWVQILPLLSSDIQLRVGKLNGPFRGPEGYTYPKPASKKGKTKDASASTNRDGDEGEGSSSITNNNNNAEVVSTATSVRPSIVLPAFKDPADMCFYFHSHFASNKQLQKKYIALSSDKVVTSSGSGHNMYYMCIYIINVSMSCLFLYVRFRLSSVVFN